jgi:hypothetical protein
MSKSKREVKLMNLYHTSHKHSEKEKMQRGLLRAAAAAAAEKIDDVLRCSADGNLFRRSSA